MAAVLPRRTKFVLDESRIPRAWYNIAADLPCAADPPLHPGTHQPIGPADLAPLFPMALIMQEVSAEREIEIPDPVREAYALYRPSPLYRAHRLEKALDTPAHIYYKYEGVSPAGSHKPNTAIAQAFYNKEEGVKRLATETGAGQWGTALAFAGAMFGLEVKVYMVRASYDQKPYRRILMETYGAQVVASPSPDDELRPRGPRRRPRLARARWASRSARRSRTRPRATTPSTRWARCSTTSCCTRRSSARRRIEQMEMAGDEPDVDHRLRRRRLELRGADVPVPRPEAARRGEATGSSRWSPRRRRRLTRGVYAYDFGDTGKMAPLVKMHTLGSRLHPGADPRRRPALPRHGAARVACSRSTASSRPRRPPARGFEAGVLFARAEGILPAPEPTHAIKVAIDEALAAKEAGEARVILFNLCGHGHFDLAAYERYLPGALEDYEYPAEKVAAALAALPGRLIATSRAGSAPACAGLRIVTCPSSPATPVAARSTRSRRSRPCSPRSGGVPAAGPTWTPSGAPPSGAPDVRPPEPAHDPGPPAATSGAARGAARDRRRQASS